MKINISEKEQIKSPSKRVKILTNTCIKSQIRGNEKTSQLSIKVLPTKFILYLNQINSSMMSSRLKSSNKFQNNDIKNSMFQSSDASEMSYFEQHKTKTLLKSGKWNEKKKQLKKYTVIEANKINGKLNGKAILQTANGAIFKGQVQDGQLKTGLMVFPDGSQYQGGFKNNVFHGEGKIKLKNNKLYISTFTNGTIGRIGQIHYCNGDVYKGQIYEFKKHGVGQLKLHNGNRYAGQFYSGQIQGMGTYYVNQFPTAKGRWNKGQLIDNCTSLSEQADSNN